MYADCTVYMQVATQFPNCLVYMTEISAIHHFDTVRGTRMIRQTVFDGIWLSSAAQPNKYLPECRNVCNNKHSALLTNQTSTLIW